MSYGRLGSFIQSITYFFVANLLTTDSIAIFVRSAMQYLIVILYLFDLNSDSANTVLQLFVSPIFVLFHLMTVLLLITVSIERMIVIGFPYCHRSIMTNKTVVYILTIMWSLSFILTIIIIIIVPINIMWPLALVDYNTIITSFFALP